MSFGTYHGRLGVICQHHLGSGRDSDCLSEQEPETSYEDIPSQENILLYSCEPTQIGSAGNCERR